MEWLVVLFLAWVLPGAFAASWLAGVKGYGQGNWFLVGLFFGPLGILTVGLAPRGYIGFKHCVECDEPVRPLATRCPYCATDLIAAEADGVDEESTG